MRPMWRLVVAVALCVAVVSGVGACGSSDEPAVTQVLADPVLRTALDPLVAENPLAPNPVVVDYGSAATGGDRAAVLATADAAAFESLSTQGRLAGEPQLFARSHLVLVTAPGNPEGVHSVADLNRPDVAAVLADASSALGDASALSFAQAKSRAPASALRVPDGAAVVAAIASGQADAGIAEAAVPAGGLEVVELPETERVELDYRAAPITASQAAVGFITLLFSQSGRDALTAAGFELP